MIGASVSYVDADGNSTRVINFVDNQERDKFKQELKALLDRHSKKTEFKDGIPF